MAATGRDEGSGGATTTSALTTADSATTDRIALEITSAKLSVSGQCVETPSKATKTHSFLDFLGANIQSLKLLLRLERRRIR